MLFRYLMLALLFATHLSFAAEFDPVQDTAEQFVKQQTRNLPAKIGITMGKLDTSRLPPCSAYEAFAPPGTRLSGKTRIGVRCLGPSSWSVLVPVQIAVTGNYLVTARPLAAGQIIQAGDLVSVSGDVSLLPSGIIGDVGEAIGKTLRNSINSGQVLRQEQLWAQPVVRQGQTVRVISKGNGFSASAEGKALNNAAVGQVVQVRMNTGQTISGMAQADGSIEIAF